MPRTRPWCAVSAGLSEDAGLTVAVDRAAQPGQTYFYRLVGTTNGGTQAVFGPVKGTAGAPRELALSSAWPNPTRGAPTTMRFTVPRDAKLRLSVADLQGREVAVLAEGEYAAGRYQVDWDGRTDRGAVAPGLYFIRLSTSVKTIVTRLAIAR